MFKQSSKLLLVLVSLTGASQAASHMQADSDNYHSGGKTTAFVDGRHAFTQPAKNMSIERRVEFSVGNNFFKSPWVIAPSSTTARDGLGPLYNATSCRSCHVNNGRGKAPDIGNKTAVSALLRLSIPATTPAHQELVQYLGVVPEPNYGTQFQDMAIPGVLPEGKVRVDYSYENVSFDDGTVVELRKPNIQLQALNYGALHPDTQFSLRLARPMIGLGLLEAIAEADILAQENPDDQRGDGITGRANRVWDQETQTVQLGRFGWKAGKASLREQNADAFIQDLGLTSELRPKSNCMPKQTECASAPNGGEPEIIANIEQKLLFFTRTLAVPARRNLTDEKVVQGAILFRRTGCVNCHTPSFTTRQDAAEPELAGQKIYPYTDLLLHDMGEGLADNRPEFLATGSEWRTPPLWGIGLTEIVHGHTEFLHDGRARNLLEAVLWHGGEAETAKQRVLGFNQEQREALLAFLNSL
ncbi:di-heme oxidoredictase family protein [Pseudomonas sp. F1_0610]|uniref:di-heme oxidoreductase family protein n=1 Tax=Pseudomonas sp. F1_0610 TaxID=3114284 RepID=UPI0039C0AF51